MARTAHATSTSVAARIARRLGTVLAVVAIGAGSAVGAAGTAVAAPVHHVKPVASSRTNSPAAAMEAQFLSLLNKHRVANHEKPVTMSADLVGVATRWSAKMAGGVGLEHNPKLPGQVKNWEVLGENVGVGTDVVTLDKAFWASPGHRANELYRTFTQVGIGVVTSGGQVWVTFDLRQPLHTLTKKG